MVWACLWHTHFMTAAVQLVEESAVVGNIVVVGALTCCALLHSMCDLKVAQMNVLYHK